MIKDFKIKLLISIIITIPVILISSFFARIINNDIFRFAEVKYLELSLSTIVFIYGGMPFFKGTFSELKNKRPGMIKMDKKN
ncbi:hypothetical protein [Mycoplasma miroungirhinis]|uniref:Uncharacterized protein n=1 Tax=Mycoplasma miroungirhinis TaxID=754516 RepID=A0A6M4JB14_9MOLU|nr:hypothetical protein [Mycoplasma miroungirhinis]QJR44173.1 hypothetical protein HLA92_01870 [Mycoplasma miroungirhinis]